MTCLSDLANHVHIRFINYGFSQILFPQVWNHSFTIALLLSKPSAFHLSMQTGMVFDNMAPTWMNSDDINILTNNKQRTKQSKGQNKRNTTISTSTLIFFPLSHILTRKAHGVLFTYKHQKRKGSTYSYLRSKRHGLVFTGIPDP